MYCVIYGRYIHCALEKPKTNKSSEHWRQICRMLFQFVDHKYIHKNTPKYILFCRKRNMNIFNILLHKMLFITHYFTHYIFLITTRFREYWMTSLFTFLQLQAPAALLSLLFLMRLYTMWTPASKRYLKLIDGYS